jgi:hypothetical protein
MYDLCSNIHELERSIRCRDCSQLRGYRHRPYEENAALQVVWMMLTRTGMVRAG